MIRSARQPLSIRVTLIPSIAPADIPQRLHWRHFLPRRPYPDQIRNRNLEFLVVKCTHTFANQMFYHFLNGLLPPATVFTRRSFLSHAQNLALRAHKSGFGMGVNRCNRLIMKSK
jgi:hypothetical protein